MTSQTTVIFSIFVYFGVIIVNRQLPELNTLKGVKLHDTAYSKNHLRVWLLPRPRWGSSRISQGFLVSCDRINSHPTTLSTITSRPMPLSDIVYVAYICFVAVLLDLCFVPRPTGSLPLNPTGRLLFSRPLCRLDPCSCRPVYAYLLSSTRQRFAVFRLSVKQVTSQADKHA